MIDHLARHPGSIYLLLAVYFTVNVLLRLAAPDSLELDESQQILFAQSLALGYNTQPPFYNWLQYGVVQVMGSSVAAVSILKNLLLFSSYLLFGLAAHLVLRDRVLAIIATLGLITLPQVGYEAQRDLTHTVAVLFASCMFAHFFFRALRQPTALSYALTGLAIGIGMLSKYNFALLPLAAAVALLLDRRLSARLLDPRILLTVAVAAAVVAPHALWFLDNFDRATGGTMQKLVADSDGRSLMQIATGLLDIVTAFGTFALPTLAAFAFAFGWTLPASWKARSQWTALIGRMFVIALALLVLVVVIGGASDIKDRWLLPSFLLLPIYLCAKIEASGVIRPDAARRLGVIILAVMVTVPLALFLRTPILGAIGEYGKQNVPYGPAAVAIMASSEERPSLVVAGDQHLAGNLRLHAPTIPVIVAGLQHLHGPISFDAARPVLLVWRHRDGEPTSDLSGGLRRWLDRQQELAGAEFELREAALPYHYGREGDAYHFGYAWVYPAEDTAATVPSEGT